MVSGDERTGALGASFESVLAECLEAFAERGAPALDEACARHPELAARLRERVDSLARLGMLSVSEERTHFGRYELVRKLGEGGMGVVYLARDPRSNAQVALKVARLAIGPDDRARARFEREIKAFAQLAHACVVPVLDVGEVDGRAYFTMEFVEGATLARVVEELQRERLAFDALTTAHLRRIVGADDALDATTLWGRTYVESVCRIVLDIASALAHAHEQGIVHRDVKPSNVMLRRDGRALLFDLGLAHLADQPSLTRSGDFAGTPYYVSPEQITAKSGEIDRRTDVYSLGVTLYELLALRRPFEAPTSARVLRRIQTAEPPRLCKLNPAVPRDLETICAAAMEKSRERRYASMDAFAADLRAFLAFKPVRARPASLWRRTTRRARGNPLLAATCALACALAIGVPGGLLWANSRIRSERDRATQAASEAREQAQLNAAQSNFLVQLFELAQTPGAAANAGELLDRGVERLQQRSDLEPLVRAALFEAAAQSYVNLGRDKSALPLFDRAFALRQRELGENHVDVARLLLELAGVHARQHDASSAIALAERGLAAFEKCGAGASLDAGRCHRVLAEARLERRELELADHHLREAQRVLAPLREAGADNALVQERMGDLARARGQTDAALERYALALAAHRAQWSPDATPILRTLDKLAALDDLRGELAAARRWRAEADELRRASDAPDEAPRPPNTPVDALALDFEPTWRAEFDAQFQAGITALQTGEHAVAVERFARCRELAPHHPTAAYNAACGHSLAGDVDAALPWLARAVEDGFAYSDVRFEVACLDSDLALVRADPRSAPLLAAMRAQRAAAQAYAADAARFVPASTAPERGWPVLVVLHDRGSTKERVIASDWRAIAAEVGAVLLAPSGSYPTAGAPADGMSWVESFARFAGAPEQVELAVRAALDALASSVRIDRERVVIAGEGWSAPIAFDLAVRAPGTFASVLLYDGPPFSALPVEQLRAAASLGLGVDVALTANAPTPGVPSVKSAVFPRELQTWLTAHGFRGANVIELGAAPDARARTVELVRMRTR